MIIIAILILLSSLLLSKAEESLCLGTFTSSYDSCNFCFNGFYRDQIPTLGDATFSGSFCLESKAESYSVELYVSSIECKNENLCDGSILAPFDNLIKALEKIHLEANRYKGPSYAVIYLLGNVHHILKDDLAKQETTFFRRVNIQVTIEPFFCKPKFYLIGCFDEYQLGKPVVKLNTNSIFFYVSSSLTIKNVTFDAINSNVDNINDCQNKKSEPCCSLGDLSYEYSEETPCGLLGIINLAKPKGKYHGFFTIEPMADCLDIKPVLTLIDFDFINFNSKGESDTWDSLIYFTVSNQGTVHIKGCKFVRILFALSLIYSVNTNSQVYYCINHLNAKSAIATSANNLEAMLIIEDTLINKYNDFEIFLFYNSIQHVLNLENFGGIVRLLNMKINKSMYIDSLILISGYDLTKQTQIFIKNLFIVETYSYNSLIRISFTQAQMENLYLTQNQIDKAFEFYAVSLANITGLSLDNQRMPTSTMFHLEKTTFYISNSIFDHINPPFDDMLDNRLYFIIRVYTLIEATMEEQATGAIYREPPYSFDRVYIDRCAFSNIATNILNSETTVISLEITNTNFTNFFLNTPLPLIKVQAERYGRFENLTINSINVNNKFLKMIFTRNFTMVGIKVKDANFTTFIDIYCVSQISPGAYLSFSVFKNCRFENIICSYSSDSEISYLLYLNYFTLFSGIYRLSIDNCFFKDVAANQAKENYLFYFAAGHHVLTNSYFEKIGNMTLFRFFSRLTSSDISIVNTTFLMQKYTWDQIYFVSSAYYVGNLSLIRVTVESDRPFRLAHALEFYNTNILFIDTCIFRNLTSVLGNLLRVAPDYLRNVFIKNSQFLNNTGGARLGADIVIKINYNSTTLFRGFPDIDTPKATFGIINCLFDSSNGWGSITLLGGEYIITNCLFKNIQSKAGGAAISADVPVDMYLANCSFENIEGYESGGALRIKESRMLIFNTIISRTKSLQMGGFLNAIRKSRIVINKCNFINMMAENGALAFVQDSEITFIMVDAMYATAHSYGGFIFLKNCIIILNQTSFFYGYALSASALYGDLVELRVRDLKVIFCKSSVEKSQGTIYLIGMFAKVSQFSNFNCSFNEAMNAACLYTQDANITFNVSTFIQNKANIKHVIDVYSASQNTNINFTNCNFDFNYAANSLLMNEWTRLIITNCTFINNSLGTGVIGVMASILELKALLFQNNKKCLNNEIYNIIIKTSSKVTVEKVEFDNEYEAAGLFCKLCQLLSIINSAFSKSFQTIGGCLRLESSEVSLTSTVFQLSRAKDRGAAIFSISGNLTVSNSKFLNNKADSLGSDLYFESSQAKLIIFGCSFSSSLLNLVFLKDSNASITKTNIENTEGNCCAQAFLIQNSPAFEIQNVVIRGLHQMGAIGIMSTRASVTAVVKLSHVSFYNCSNKNSGGFIYSVGPVFISIDNAIMQNGTAENGGAIYIECEYQENCSLYLGKNVSFYDCEAKNIGGAVYSLTKPVEVSEDTRLLNNKAAIGDNIYDEIKQMFILWHIQTASELSGYLKSNLIADRDSGNLSITPNFKVRSGVPFNIAVVLVDSRWNIYETESDSILSIEQVKGNATTAEFLIEKGNVKVNKGLGFFENVSIVNPILDTYKLVIKLIDNSIAPYEFTVTIIPCLKGEFFSNSRCLECPEGFFSLDRDALTTCKSCPANAKCLGGDYIVPEIGFWRQDEDSSMVIKCIRDDSCDLGVMKMGGAFNFKCKEGYYGNLCFDCETGWGLLRNGCIKCDDRPELVGYFFLKLGFYYFLLLIEIYLFFNFQNHSILRVLTNFNFIIIIISSLEVERSDPIIDALFTLNKNINIYPSDLFEFSCTLLRDTPSRSRLQIQLDLQLTVPLLLTVIYFPIYFISRAGIFIITKERLNFETLIRDLRQKVLFVFLVNFRNAFPRVCSRMFQLFSCSVLHSDETSYMSLDPNVACWGQDHSTLILRGFLPFMMIWVLGYSLFVFFLMKKNQPLIKAQPSFLTIMKDKSLGSHSGTLRDSSNNSMKTAAFVNPNQLTMPNNSLKKFLAYFFVSDFKTRFFYFQYLEHIFQVLFILICEICESLDGFLQRMVLDFILASMFLVYRNVRPYENDINNSLMVTAYFVGLGVIIFEFAGSESDSGQSRAKSLASIILVWVSFFYVNCAIRLVLAILNKFAPAQTEERMSKGDKE